ncbi:YidB family protein [Variovorax sp. J22G47]|uniref:YidB family protein n=2 Tax=Variovorax fucosicus TaxID=3053517 RepID=UPI0025777FBF|nr:YidB family protein [Variovorax sp. J22G47]MDM0055066.1 YidB family protein [Variovorax sp. J22G47]
MHAVLSHTKRASAHNQQGNIMGLLDSVLGQVLGGGAQQQQPGGGLGGLGDLGGLAGALGGLLANNGEQGGLGGLVTKFEQAGMGDVIGSWIGKGENAPVSGNQLNDVLGSDTIAAIASKLGINAQTLLPMLATMLPALIDHLTPHGKVPEEGVGNHDDLLASLSGLLQKG